MNVLQRLYKALFFDTVEKSLGVVIPDNSVMFSHMDLWLKHMMGRAPYLFDQNKTRKAAMRSMSLPSVVTREFAKLCLLEYETLVLGGSSRATWLQEQHDKLLLPMLKQVLQWALGLGNVVLKPRFKDGRLFLGYVIYPNFIPVKWDDERLTGVVFKTELTRGKKIYTLFEHMDFADGILSVNYASFARESDVATDDVGVPIPLTDIPEWSDLTNYEIVTSRPWFVHWRTPALNNVDPNSPLGVSVMTNSEDTIRNADEGFSALRWEIQAGRVRTMLPRTMFTRAEDGKIIIPDPEDRYYMAYEGGPMGEGRPEQFAPALRVQELTEAVKFNLRVLESQLSFSEGTLSLTDVRRGMVTATQVTADKKDTFEALTYLNDNMVKPGIAEILNVFSEIADVLGVPMSGGGAFEISTEMNTQASVDPAVRFNQAMELYQMRLIPARLPIQYSQLQVTEDEAAKLYAEARAEMKADLSQAVEDDAGAGVY